jgi:hypothetical protein
MMAAKTFHGDQKFNELIVLAHCEGCQADQQVRNQRHGLLVSRKTTW